MDLKHTLSIKQENIVEGSFSAFAGHQTQISGEFEFIHGFVDFEEI